MRWRSCCCRGHAPAFFEAGNLRDLLMSNMPVLIVAMGMTLVILTRRDRHLGGLGVRDLQRGRGRAAAKAGLPTPVAGLVACLAGGAAGSLERRAGRVRADSRRSS